MKKGILKKLVALTGVSMFAAISSQVFAAGYKLEFQSVSTLADAGDAAVVEDAGTNWYNSAGLTRLPLQVVLAGTQMYQVSKFSGTSTTPSPFGFVNNQAGRGTSYITPFLPAIHVSIPLSERFAFGYSIVPDWGLSEDWGDRFSFLRYDLTKIYTKPLDVAPSLAWKINSQWSVAAGPDFQYLALQYKNKVMLEPSPATVTPDNDTNSRISADAWNTGFHVGVLFTPNEATRIGLNYRSKIVMNLVGQSDLAPGLSPIPGLTSPLSTGAFTYHTVFPATTSLSGYRDINDRWAVMGTIAYDQWSVIRYNHAQNYQGVPVPGNPSGLLNVVIPEFYSDVLDLSAGAHYKWSDTVLLRGSIKYLGTPTHTTTRNIEFPDGRKLGFNIGARLTVNKKIAVDLIYGHVLVAKANINNVSPSGSGARVNGSVTTSIDIAGAQLVWTI